MVPPEVIDYMREDGQRELRVEPLRKMTEGSCRRLCGRHFDLVRGPTGARSGAGG
jgi:hypothetical protein